jgi:UDP-N-acetylmuramyl pentapeptide phosphotransferase/UDP-N-acetylglucosamine-1-phosphate transferase
MTLIPIIIAGLLATLLAGLIVWSGPIDPPGPRRSHGRPTPTSGGLAILVATCLDLAIDARWGQGVPDPRLGWLAGAAALTGLMGAADDMLDLPARTKLLVQAAIALLFARSVVLVTSLPVAPGVELPLGLLAGIAGTALWFIVLTNAVNFVDGVDGLAPGAVVIVWLGVAGASALHGQGVLTSAALIGAVAGLGFLPWNLPAHRLFQGDAGALFSGVFLAGVAVLATDPASGEPLSPYMVPLATLPMLTDVLLTLLARARARSPLFSAHREHLYQRWLDKSGGGHAALSVRYWLIMAAFTGAAILNEQAPRGWRAAGFVVALAAAVAGWVWLRARVGRRTH